MKQVSTFKIKSSILIELYETIIGELLELKEFYVAGEIYKECSKYLLNEEKGKSIIIHIKLERCLRL